MSQELNPEAITPPTDASPAEAPKEELIPRAHADKILQEKKNWAEKAKAAEAQLEALRMQQLKEKDDQKALAETYLKKSQELEQQLQSIKQKEVQNYKFTHFKKELEKMGLRDPKQAEAFFKLSNQEAMKYDEDHGIVLGHEEEAKKIRDLIPQAFGQSMAGVNHAAPQGAPSTINMETYNAMIKDGSFHKLSKLEQREITSKLWSSFGVTRK